MPNITAQVTYFFEESSGGAGWTESYYMTGASLAAVHAVASAQANINARLGLLALGYQMGAVRSSDIAVLGDSLLTALTPTQGAGQYPAPGHPAPGDDFNEEPYDAVLLRLEATSARRRMFLMRGLPIGIITQERQYTPPAPWIQRFNAWVQNVLVTMQIQLRTSTRTLPTAVTTILPFGANRALILTASAAWNAAFFPVAGQPLPTIKLTQFTGAIPINHYWRVMSGAGVSISTKQNRRTIYGVPNNDGLVWLVTYAPTSVTNIIPLRGVKKDTGRPFDLLRGRRLVRQQ